MVRTSLQKEAGITAKSPAQIVRLDIRNQTTVYVGLYPAMFATSRSHLSQFPPSQAHIDSRRRGMLNSSSAVVMRCFVGVVISDLAD